jgi:hypothetical protein
LDEITIERPLLGYCLSVTARYLGSDLLVTVTGGCREHIGAVTVASPDGKSSGGTILLPTHKDDAVSRLFAERLSSLLGTTVCAVCGIHYDNASADDIRAIVDNAKELLSELESALKV